MNRPYCKSCYFDILQQVNYRRNLLKEEERKIRLTEPWMGEGSTEGIEDKSTETKPDKEEGE